MHTIARILVALLAASHAAAAQTQLAAAPADQALDSAAALLPTSINYWEFASGFDSSKGTYGALQPTTVSYVPVALSYHAARWSVSLESGYLRVTGPLSYIDVTNLDAGRNPAVNGAVNGIADTAISAKYAVYEDLARGFFVDAGARLRAPTASRAKGLGTGHAAGDLTLDLTQVAGQWTFFGGGEYGIRDSRDAERNPWSATAGFGRSFTERWSAGAFYHFRQSVLRGAGAAHDLFAYTSYALSRRFTVTLYGATGFSHASVDRELGLRYALRWP